jgi:CheY-like chemotaxis protein
VQKDRSALRQIDPGDRRKRQKGYIYGITSFKRNGMMEQFFLLADDDHDDAELFGEALALVDPPVDFYHVGNGQEVIRYLSLDQNKKPDIIFLDVNMPEVNGWQCLKTLRGNQDFSHIPVIMYSTSSNPRDKQIASESGATGFLTKPSDFKVLVNLLNSIARTSGDDLRKLLQQITIL